MSRVPSSAWLPLSLILAAASLSRAAELRNRPELDLPLTDARRVVAHYMTDMTFFKGHRVSDSVDPRHYRPDGPARALGGLTQHVPMAAHFLEGASLDESAAFEMRAAMRLGVDGFQFFYPCVLSDPFLERYGQIIRAFFRVADAQRLDFKLTLCLCSPEKGTQARKIAHWSKHIRSIVGATRNSPHWLTTPDGRRVVFLWCPDGLTDRLAHHWLVHQHPEHVAHVAAAYERLAQAAGIRAAYVYHLRWPKDRAHVEAVLDHFPAVWGWTDSFAPDDGWDHVAARCKARRRDYTQTVYPDYYTSKLYPRRKDAPMLHRLDEALKLGLAGVERHIQRCRLSCVFRKLLERAVRTDASMINLATWNDYPEGHHLAPEINHNFGFARLLRYYRRAWRSPASPIERETAIAFFKKYPHDVRPEPFDIACRVKRAAGDAADEDGIEVVTILREPAVVVVRGVPRRAPAGLAATTFPMRPGPVYVRVERRGTPFIEFTCPEWITRQPYRTDRLTYCYSSDFPRLFRDLFGDRPPWVSDEYAETQAMPNWRKRYSGVPR